MITGKVLNAQIDQHGNVKVATEYTLTDGTKIIGHTRYNFINYTREKVLEDVKTHCETLMKKVYGLKKHQELINEVNLSNAEYSCSSMELVIKPEKKDPQGNIIQVKETITINDT